LKIEQLLALVVALAGVGAAGCVQRYSVDASALRALDGFPERGTVALARTPKELDFAEGSILTVATGPTAGRYEVRGASWDAARRRLVIDTTRSGSVALDLDLLPRVAVESPTVGSTTWTWLAPAMVATTLTALLAVVVVGGQVAAGIGSVGGGD